MLTFIVKYYDIGWNIHTHQVKAETIEQAIEQTMRETRCARNEIITIFNQAK